MSASEHMLEFTRRGVYLTHRGAAARETVAAEPAHVLLFNRDAPFRVSHPTDQGDATTTLVFSDDVVREAAIRHDRGTWRDGAAPFTTSHVLAAPEMLIRLHTLRRRLRVGVAGAAEAEETSLEILDGVVDAAARARGARPDAQRPTTRRARRELVEAVKTRLAAAPADDVSLATLAREMATSPFHLARTFRAGTGLPVHQFLLRLRTTIALARLGDPSLPLSVLAHELGFASHAHLTTAFRRVFGVAPSWVRRTA
jgi:AraC-like DNA-binding protein